MKFLKGMLLGGIVSTGIWMMYKEKMINKNKMIKRGKQFMKKMGTIYKE